MGINIRRLYMITFGIGAACAGVSGAAIAPFIPVYPYVGWLFVITAFVVVVLGAWATSWGLCGRTDHRSGRQRGAMFLPGAMKSIISFTIFIIILLFKPQVSSGGEMAETRGHLKRKLGRPTWIAVVCVLAALHLLPWLFPSILHIMIMIFLFSLMARAGTCSAATQASSLSATLCFSGWELMSLRSCSFVSG